MLTSSDENDRFTVYRGKHMPNFECPWSKYTICWLFESRVNIPYREETLHIKVETEIVVYYFFKEKVFIGQIGHIGLQRYICQWLVNCLVYPM